MKTSTAFKLKALKGACKALLQPSKAPNVILRGIEGHFTVAAIQENKGYSVVLKMWNGKFLVVDPDDIVAVLTSDWVKRAIDDEDD